MNEVNSQTKTKTYWSKTLDSSFNRENVITNYLYPFTEAQIQQSEPEESVGKLERILLNNIWQRYQASSNLIYFSCQYCLAKQWGSGQLACVCHQKKLLLTNKPESVLLWSEEQIQTSMRWNSNILFYYQIENNYQWQM